MKAIVIREFGEPEVMRVEEVVAPVPADGQVLIAMKAAGVNPVDTYVRTGTYPLKPELPYIPGMDGSGIVEATGRGVKKFSAGDRVYVSRTLRGSYAEKALCLESQVHPLPAMVSFQQGAGVGVPYGAACHALFGRAKVSPGETVLVHGATGGVGIAAVQMARAAGMVVIGTGGTEKGRRLVKEQGCHHVFDHRAPDYADRILEVTEGRGVDVIIEMLGNVNLGKDLRMIARSGRIVVVGSRGTTEINPRDIMGRDAAILGMVILNASESELYRAFALIDAGLESGTLRPVIGKELPLAEAARSHHDIMGSSAYGKIVLTV